MQNDTYRCLLATVATINVRLSECQTQCECVWVSVHCTIYITELISLFFFAFALLLHAWQYFNFLQIARISIEMYIHMPTITHSHFVVDAIVCAFMTQKKKTTASSSSSSITTAAASAAAEEEHLISLRVCVWIYVNVLQHTKNPMEIVNACKRVRSNKRMSKQTNKQTDKQVCVWVLAMTEREDAKKCIHVYTRAQIHLIKNKCNGKVRFCHW